MNLYHVTISLLLMVSAFGCSRPESLRQAKAMEAVGGNECFQVSQAMNGGWIVRATNGSIWWVETSSWNGKIIVKSMMLPPYPQ